jgi:hypothetical protein
MTDTTFRDWLFLSERKITVIRDGTSKSQAQEQDEADCIPDWAAMAVLLGFILAVVGFISAWINNRGWSMAVLALGLIIAAIGMRAAENAVEQKARWRPI